MIRDNVALAEAPAQRKDIFSYNKNSNGAKDYLSLCREIIERVEMVVARCQPIKRAVARHRATDVAEVGAVVDVDIRHLVESDDDIEAPVAKLAFELAMKRRILRVIHPAKG